MSSFGMLEYTCAVCGSTKNYNVLMSTNTFGGTMDLDTRPPEMQRSTMDLWVHECPNCGYVAGEVSDETEVTTDFLSSEDYQTCNRLAIKSDLARRFYKQYLICIHDGKLQAAFTASLRAAWASDDAYDFEVADICRNQCIELLSKINAEGENPTLTVMKADFLRRTGRFEEVISEYSGMKLGDDVLQKIIEFQVLRSKERDVSVYTLGDVVS